MDLNWEAIGAIGEIAGAIAVFASLAYLAVQIRSNTAELRSKSGWDAHHTFADVNDYIAQGGPLTELVFKSVDPNTDPSDLSDLENFQVHAFARGMFQRLEAQYFLYRNGTLEPEIWENRKSYNRGLLDLPIYSAWWKLEVENAQYTKEFINEINTANKTKVLFMHADGNTKDV